MSVCVSKCGTEYRALHLTVGGTQRGSIRIAECDAFMFSFYHSQSVSDCDSKRRAVRRAEYRASDLTVGGTQRGSDCVFKYRAISIAELDSVWFAFITAI